MLSRTMFLLVLSALAVLGAVAGIGFWAGLSSSEVAAWVQALGAIAAVLVISAPIILERRLARQQAREMVLAAAELAYGTMSAVARRNTDPNYHGSEWWVPQWDILRKVLADAPIWQVGCAKALTEFVALQEVFARAAGFDEPWGNEPDDIDPTKQSYITSLMLNANSNIEELRKILGASGQAST